VAGRSLKAAPRRSITSIERHGDWGEVEYHHHLACGHTEIRKRRSSAPVLACSGCVTASEFAAGRMPSAPPARYDEPHIDSDAALETEAGRIRAGLAKRFGVPAEAVDVALRADSGIAYALVFLDAAAALRLSSIDDVTAS
jgi:hypothetical protein